MDLRSALARRDELIDRYLLVAGPREKTALALFLLDGEDSMAAMTVPTAIRQAQARVLDSLETETEKEDDHERGEAGSQNQEGAGRD